MASIFCCWRACANVLDLGVVTPRQAPVIKQPLVNLDPHSAGREVVVVKNGLRACGSGGVLGSAAIMQDKAYFEVRVQQTGAWSVGLATDKADLDRPQGGGPATWVFGHDGALRHDAKELHRFQRLPQEGDTVGVSYNHDELNFYINGEKLEHSLTNVKGTVYPALFGESLRLFCHKIKLAFLSKR